MPVVPEENSKYVQFVHGQIEALNGMKVEGSQIVWHYTTGDALMRIVQLDTLYSTQVSCLNDSTEVRYAETFLKNAFIELQKEAPPDKEAQLLEQLIKGSAVDTKAAFTALK